MTHKKQPTRTIYVDEPEWEGWKDAAWRERVSVSELIRRAVAAEIAKYGRNDDELSFGSATVQAGGSPPPKGGSGDVRMAPTPAGTRGHHSGTRTLGNVAAQGEGTRRGSDGGGGAPPVPRTSAVALDTVSRKPFTKEQQTRKRGAGG